MIRSVVLFLVAPLTLLGAPTPPVRVRQQPYLAGGYRLDWGDTTVTCRLCPDGTWLCVWHGRLWRGKWRIHKGRLHVEEKPQDSDWMPAPWELPIRNNQIGDGTIRLVPLKE
jgi:hypothetical protein